VHRRLLYSITIRREFGPNNETAFRVVQEISNDFVVKRGGVGGVVMMAFIRSCDGEIFCNSLCMAISSMLDGSFLPTMVPIIRGCQLLLIMGRSFNKTLVREGLAKENNARGVIPQPGSHLRSFRGGVLLGLGKATSASSGRRNGKACAVAGVLGLGKCIVGVLMRCGGEFMGKPVLLKSFCQRW